MESPSIALECFEALTLIGDFFLPYIVNSSAEDGWLRVCTPKACQECSPE